MTCKTVTERTQTKVKRLQIQKARVKCRFGAPEIERSDHREQQKGPGRCLRRKEGRLSRERRISRLQTDLKPKAQFVAKKSCIASVARSDAGS